MTIPARRPYPVSTYRLQLHGGFGFAAARRVIAYLAALGVTDCYSSPHLRANPGSSHGYDTCDHRQLNPELGTTADYEAFSAELRAHGFGHIVDIVPNHMAADSLSNPWWRDVLENGESSLYGEFFDVDWNPVKPELTGRVLLPVLGDQYGRVLDRGELRLEYAAGAVVLRYFDLNLPLNPRALPIVLGLDGAAVGHALHPDDPDAREYLSILTGLANLPATTERDPERRAERAREKEVARERLVRLVASSSEVRAHVDACLRHANGEPGRPESFDRLHELLEAQAYRLAYWRTAFDEVNYRRFFDVNGLVALRMEEPRVFEATHALLRELVAAGHITGFRVDHPDGLFDPRAYLERLEEMARAARPLDLAPAGSSDRFYFVVEKILSAGEALSDEWPVAGTTGYDFLNLVAGLFIDGRQARPLRRAYTRLTGQQDTFAVVAFQSKRVITLTSMASELSVLAHGLNRISEADRQYRDFTLDSCRKALREVLACCPVYRTYITERGWTAFDRGVIEAAIKEASERNPLMEESIFEFIHDVLLPPDGAAGVPDDPAARERRRFAMKLQQFSGPVQAKGVEDTAFYRYHVLAAANDVGGHPGQLGVMPAAFHEANARRLEAQPFGMLATSTHDTKRGEDARMRLSVLSELPTEWRRMVAEWMRLNARNRTRLGSLWAPDRNDEYLFYQAVLGAWPPETADQPVPDRAPADLVARIDAYMQKAVREAKVHTSWINQDQEYGRAVAGFVERTLAGRTAARFLASAVPFARRVARAGAVNALAQLTLKLAAPGVPDFYQGSELWDFSLVDPDNRRPVDFDHRARLLDGLEPLIAAADAGTPAEDGVAPLLASWPDGRIKLLATACGLRFRRAHAAFMAGADYVPLVSSGAAADSVVAFARHDRRGTLIAVAPRLVAAATASDRWPVGANLWSDTALAVPSGLTAARYRHLVTGEIVDAPPSADGTTLSVARVFGTCPFALLWADPPANS
jgi:(1->4)-alpha-D-glucan 1-alpha-D-glucosylmutase